jgi:archaellum component FlaC
MKITEIEYGETRTFGNYQNVSVHFRAEVGSLGMATTQKDVQAAYERLRALADEKINESIRMRGVGERLHNDIEKLKWEFDDLSKRVNEKEAELGRLRQQISKVNQVLGVD